MTGRPRGLIVAQVNELVGVQRLTHSAVARILGVPLKKVNDICSYHGIRNDTVANGVIRRDRKTGEILEATPGAASAVERRILRGLESWEYQQTLIRVIREYSPQPRSWWGWRGTQT